MENSLSKGPNFIDLGLPSGTLWADDFLRDDEGNILYLPCVEAVKYGIPSLEQWTEFQQNSRCNPYQTQGESRSVTFTAVNGKNLTLEATGFKMNLDGSTDWANEVVFIIDKIIINNFWLI